MSDDSKIHVISPDSNRLLELKLDPVIPLNLIFQVENFLQVTVYRILYNLEGHDSSNFQSIQACWENGSGQWLPTVSKWLQC